MRVSNGPGEERRTKNEERGTPPKRQKPQITKMKADGDRSSPRPAGEKGALWRSQGRLDDRDEDEEGEDQGGDFRANGSEP